jgi:hypothetical protein
MRFNDEDYMSPESWEQLMTNTIAGIRETCFAKNLPIFYLDKEDWLIAEHKDGRIERLRIINEDNALWS